MAAATPSPKYPTFASLYSHMKATIPAPLAPPAKASFLELSSAIAGLSLHPTLESALHILNNDLLSAHFLVRHMESPPAYAGMFLHGILHRVEGDYDNARAWYQNVAESEVFISAWSGGLADARAYIDCIEKLVKRKEGSGEELEKESRREIESVIQWCQTNYGEQELRDASEVWVRPDEGKRKMGQDMIVGGEGWRKF